MTKPNIENLSAIIDKLEKLKDQKEKFKKTEFLTPVQQRVLHARTDIKWYIWELPKAEKQEHFYNHDIPLHYVKAKDGRFIVTDENELKLYGEDKSGVPAHRGERVDLDEKFLVDVLRTVLKEARRQYWQENLQPLIKEVDKLLFPHWDYLATAGSWGTGEQARIEAAIQSKDPVDLDEVLREFDKIKYKVTLELRPLSSKKPSKIKQKSKIAKRGKKKISKISEKDGKFLPWENSGDACFLTEGNRVKFHHKDKIKDLRLKSESRTHRLLFLLKTGSSQLEEIKTKICSVKSKPSKVVAYANRLLNKKIAQVGFIDVPKNVQYIRYDKTYNSYSSALKIWAIEEFDRKSLQQPLVNDE